MKQLAIRLGYQPKNFWPGTRKTITKSLVMMKQLVKQLAIPLSNQKTVAKWLVIAIRLGYQPKNFWPGTRKALHSHLTKLANYANQVIG
jgi:lambda repressor-like predicted transcriptional regulator